MSFGYKDAKRAVDKMLADLKVMEGRRLNPMKTYIYFKSGNVYQIDPDTVRDQHGVVNIIDLFWRGQDIPLQATYICTDGTTGQIIFRLADVENIEQTR